MNIIQKILGAFGYSQPEDTKPVPAKKEEKRFRDLGNPVAPDRVRERQPRSIRETKAPEPVRSLADGDNGVLNLLIVQAAINADAEQPSNHGHHHTSHDFGQAADHGASTPSSSDSYTSHDSGTSSSYDSGSSSTYDSGSSSSSFDGGGGGSSDGGGAAFAPEMR